jgi:hypothetical protein
MALGSHRFSGAISGCRPFCQHLRRKSAHLSLEQPGAARHRGAMIASLMMYARPELEDANDRFWRGIRHPLAARDIPAPETLSQTAQPFDVWEDPALVLSQTCGMPYRTRLHPFVQLAGTLDYGLEDCSAGYYRSAIVVRTDDPHTQLQDYAGKVLAYNSGDSQSGFAALYAHSARARVWFANQVCSGAHLASAQMVAQGQADIAALDAQTWRLIMRYESWANKLRVLEYTEPTPGLPLITGAALNADLVFEAVTEALEELSKQDTELLGLKGLIRIPHETYCAVPNPPASALA